MAKDESKNEKTIISDNKSNFENNKNLAIVAVNHCVEVGSTISPSKIVEPPQKTKNLKNVKKKKQKEVKVSNTKKPFIFYPNRAKVSNAKLMIFLV
ncbi:hypothetical protein V6N13_108870 [Hibiscus sabdariffa]|uniref:Uncharacterized protein n=1 Tax=Hibiscus sabdariffa TaxID=183260 RepID=A0ABR2FN16_9ROSI